MINCDTIKGNRYRFIIGLILLIVLFAAYCYSSLMRHNTTKIQGLGTSMIVPNTTVSFDQKNWELNVKQYKSCNIVVNYKNTGAHPLFVYDVTSSCGCVEIVEWPHFPISPGETGKLTIRINTSDIGLIDKEVSVYSNSDTSPVRLRVRAEICK